MYINYLHGKKDTLYSVKIKVLNDKEKTSYSGIGLRDSIYLPCVLESGVNYTFIISIVAFGKQELKEIHNFTYQKNDLNKFDSFTISECKNKKNKKGFYVNPLAMSRAEGSRTSIYFKSNIYLLKGNLRKAFTAIKNHKDISCLNKEDIDLLIKKGVIILYE